MNMTAHAPLSVPGGASPDMVAVITAAVQVALGHSDFQVVAVRPRGSRWGRAGREAQMAARQACQRVLTRGPAVLPRVSPR